MEDWVMLSLLGVGCIVASRFMPDKASAPAANMVRELEETMEHFASEIEEENKQLLESVSQMKLVHEQQVNKLTHKIETLEKQSHELSSELKQLIFSKLQAIENGNAFPAAASASESNSEKQEDKTPQIPSFAVEQREDEQQQTVSIGLRDRFVHIFDLYDEGKSIEHIARKLGLTKGEINLILQLAKQEEENRE